NLVPELLAAYPAGEESAADQEDETTEGEALSYELSGSELAELAGDSRAEAGVGYQAPGVEFAAEAAANEEAAAADAQLAGTEYEAAPGLAEQPVAEHAAEWLPDQPPTEAPSEQSTGEAAVERPAGDQAEVAVVRSVSVSLTRPEARANDEGMLPPQAVPPGREPVAPAARPGMARVDAELLDHLLNISGEASIARSRLEQQLGSIDFNLGELSRTVTRLKEQLRNLEIETEAQILHKHEDEGTHRSEFDPLELDRYSSIQQYSRALAETANDVGSIQQLLENLGKETQN